MFIYKALSLSLVAMFSMFPIKLFLITAAEMSMPDALRWWQDIPRFLKDVDVLPISHHPCGLADIKLKIHIENSGHTQIAENLKTSTNGKKIISMNVYTQLSTNKVLWVAFAQGVAHLGMLWVLIVYSVSINCNTDSSIRQGEHSSLCSSPPRTQKVSWTPAQINVPRVPAGVVSGSPGRWGQAGLCPTGAACDLVS